MQALRRRAVCVARRSKLPTPPISRSYASDKHEPLDPLDPPPGQNHHEQNHHDHDHHDHDHHDHDHHDHHHAAPPVNEGLGPAFYIFAGALPASWLAYSLSRPGANGEPSRVSRWLNNFEYLNDTSVERSEIRTRAWEQAAYDKHLFHYSAGKYPHVELKMPELIGTGSPWAVPAGHYPKLDHVTEHYRQKYAEEEERKARKLLQKKVQEQEQEQEP